MKAIVFSDAHADHVTMGVSRFSDIERAMDSVVLAAIDEEVDAAFFLGDLADPDDGPSSLRACRLLIKTVRRLALAKINVFAIPGNHDVFEDGSGESVISALRDLQDPYVALFSKPTSFGAGDCNVVALPFTATSHAYDPHDFMMKATDMLGRPLDPNVPTFVISHLAVPGVQPGEETKEIPRGREVIYPFAAVADLMIKREVICLQGHYHRRQDFIAPQGYTIHIPGSMARLTMGEERHEPSYLIVEV